MDEPGFLGAEITRTRMPVCRSTSAMKSPPLSASRVALRRRGNDLVHLVRFRARNPAPGSGVMSPDAIDTTLFINRELSWLAFNERVLDEARDPSTPLLERLKFATIAASNLDEFFMVRVAAIRHDKEDGEPGLDLSGLNASEQFATVDRSLSRAG